MPTSIKPTNVISFVRDQPFSWKNPDLSILKSADTAVPNFPKSILGGYWADWVTSVAASKNVPLDYVGASLLTTTAALIGNSREIRMDGWEEPPILWTVLVGNPSAGKSPAMDPFSKILQSFESEMLDAQGDDEDEDEECEAALVIDDATAQAAGQVAAKNPDGLILFRDELSGWWEKFRQHGGEAFWLAAFGARPHKISRKNQRTIRVPRLAINVLGGSQPDAMRSFLTAKQNRGFASRWLYICPQRVSQFRIGKAVKLQPAQDRLRKVHRLQRSEGQPVAVSLVSKAKPRFEAWACIKSEAAKADEDGIFGQWLGKQGGVALRIALVLEHLWWAADPKAGSDGPRNVSQAAISAAMKFIDSYAEPMMVVALNNAARPVEEQDARQLAALLRRSSADQFNARAATRGTYGTAGRLAVAAAMAAACEALERSHLIRYAGVRAGERKGRRSSDYEVNPVLLQNPGAR